MIANKAFLFFYLLLSLVQAILEICLEATKTWIRHCLQSLLCIDTIGIRSKHFKDKTLLRPWYTQEQGLRHFMSPKPTH